MSQNDQNKEGKDMTPFYVSVWLGGGSVVVAFAQGEILFGLLIAVVGAYISFMFLKG
jgi:hypothetical protein